MQAWQFNTFGRDAKSVYIGSSICPKCGKPYIYIGDPIDNIRDVVCVCDGDYRFHFTRPTQGWICPRCGKSHAPWVSECDCKR